MGALRTPSERMRTHYRYRYTHYGYPHLPSPRLYLLRLSSPTLTTAILTMAHVIGEDAHDADLFVAVREGGAPRDLGELDAELRRSKCASTQVRRYASSQWG